MADRGLGYSRGKDRLGVRDWGQGLKGEGGDELHSACERGGVGVEMESFCRDMLTFT